MPAVKRAALRWQRCIPGYAAPVVPLSTCTASLLICRAPPADTARCWQVLTFGWVLAVFYWTYALAMLLSILFAPFAYQAGGAAGAGHGVGCRGGVHSGAASRGPSSAACPLCTPRTRPAPAPVISPHPAPPLALHRQHRPIAPAGGTPGHTCVGRRHHAGTNPAGAAPGAVARGGRPRTFKGWGLRGTRTADSSASVCAHRWAVSRADVGAHPWPP